MVSRRLCGTLLAASACAVPCVGQKVATPQRFSPSTIGADVIRSWGDDAMGNIMASWEKAFRRYHPEITFQDTLDGSGTGMAGIITGVSDLSLMGRAATANEVMGFEWVFRYKPLGIQAVTGGLERDGKSPALAVFVSRRNPMRQISMAELAAMLGCRDTVSTPPMWTMAGAHDEWSKRPLHAYLYDSQTGSGAFFQRTVLGEKDCWNWSMVKEFKDIVHRDGTTVAAGEQTVEALKRDPDGLAVSTPGHAKPWARELAIAGDKLPVEATAESLIDGSYPLARGVYIYINRTPGKPVDAKVKEFLRFILSEEGQRIARQQGDFLPLSPATDLAEWKEFE